MSSRQFIGPAFRLVRTLDLQIDHNGQKRPVRAEIFQDPNQPTHFRYRLWGLQVFNLPVDYHHEPLPHEVLTTFCLPNLGVGDYFEAVDLDAAEMKFYDDFRKEFSKGA